jgi:hypothetical protein
VQDRHPCGWCHLSVLQERKSNVATMDSSSKADVLVQSSGLPLHLPPCAKSHTVNLCFERVPEALLQGRYAPKSDESLLACSKDTSLQWY